MKEQEKQEQESLLVRNGSEGGLAGGLGGQQKGWGPGEWLDRTRANWSGIKVFLLS